VTCLFSNGRRFYAGKIESKLQSAVNKVPADEAPLYRKVIVNVKVPEKEKLFVGLPRHDVVIGGV
jgi:hypothetical protein